MAFYVPLRNYSLTFSNIRLCIHSIQWWPRETTHSLTVRNICLHPLCQKRNVHSSRKTSL